MSAAREVYSAWALFCWKCQAKYEPELKITDAHGSDALFWFSPEDLAKPDGVPVCCPRCGGTEISARWVIQVTPP